MELIIQIILLIGLLSQLPVPVDAAPSSLGGCTYEYEYQKIEIYPDGHVLNVSVTCPGAGPDGERLIAQCINGKWTPELSKCATTTTTTDDPLPDPDPDLGPIPSVDEADGMDEEYEDPDWELAAAAATGTFIRTKRKAIKTGGGSILRSKMSSGRGGGRGLDFRRRRILGEGGHMGEDYDGGDICENLDPLIDVSVLEKGKFDDNDTFSDGAVLNVSCGAGHFVNLKDHLVRCVKGDWKPKLPQCKALPCKVPYIAHAWCYEGSRMLYFEELIRYGKSIHIVCLPRYKLMGNTKMVCQFGEWEIDGYPPECVPDSCTLPELQYGVYLGNFIAGQEVEHDLEVDYTCASDYHKLHGEPSRCMFGEWKPERPYCVHPAIDTHYASVSGVVPANATRRGCWNPPSEPGALRYTEGRPIDPADRHVYVEDGGEILYKCMGNKTLRRNRWIRTCDNGFWSGVTMPCEGELDHELIQQLLDKINSSCFYGDREDNLVLFFNNRQPVGNDTDEFPTDSFITSRCSDIGKFQFHGATHRKCVSGQWLGTTPKCDGLSQEHDYALDTNPTILFRYVNGSIGQSNTGELVVYPGTTVHMECLWIRKFGPPKWEVRRNSTVPKEYVQGWTDGIPERFPDLEYRITIESADEDDSGLYTCWTPSRHSHTVHVIVEATSCPELPPRNSFIYSSRDRHLGAEVNLTCEGSYSLVGEANVTCLANGQWSAKLPKCERIRTRCPDPPRIEHGFVTGSPPYKPGDMARYECHYGYMMDIDGGQATSLCQDNGEWSRIPGLYCEEACSYPGAIVQGSISPVKFYYKIHETIIFDCNEGYELKGAGMVHCLPGAITSAHWSNSLPTCVKKRK